MKTPVKILYAGILLWSILISGNAKCAGSGDTTLVLQTAGNYVTSWYDGDAKMLSSLLHADFLRESPRDQPNTGETFVQHTTASGMIAAVQAGGGKLPDSSRHIGLDLLVLENNFAGVRASSATFTEYLQLVKEEGSWKILNSLFTAGKNGPLRIKDFKPELEKSQLEKTGLRYLMSHAAVDEGKFVETSDPEYIRTSFGPNNAGLRRQGFTQLKENIAAGVGKQDEIYRYNRVKILDVSDGIAFLRCDMTTQHEFALMYMNGRNWKVLNSFLLPTNLTLSQAMTVTVGEPMPDFSLPVYQGGQFKLSDYQGKNVLILFPRGWVVNGWCAYCPYQYLELEKLIRTQDIEKKYGLKVVFVMPYSKDRITDWIQQFPMVLQTVENIKNPQPAPVPGSLQSDYAAWARKHLPLRFDVKPDDSHTIIPVLVDENRSLSRQLKIFTSFWDNAASEQNMATALIIDKKGVLRFKYVSQMTEDRPSVDFLLETIRQLK